MGNLIIKMCAGTDKADAHYGKEFQLIHVPEFTMISFKQKPYPQMIIDHDAGGTIEVEGNVYVMNNDGKTITTFTPMIANDDCCLDTLENINVGDFLFYQHDGCFFVYSSADRRMWWQSEKFDIITGTLSITIDPSESNHFGWCSSIKDLLHPVSKLPLGSTGQAIYLTHQFNPVHEVEYQGQISHKILDTTSGFLPSSEGRDGRLVWSSSQKGLQGVEVDIETINTLSEKAIPRIHGLLFKIDDQSYLCYVDMNRRSAKHCYIKLTK